ncbi:MAG: MoxR family ATPase [Nanoarchaeota archaeon]|nr:MoxR family ATPase [Nanoarchaeota archaeon]
MKENKPHKKDIKIFSEKIKELKQEIRKIIIGQDNVIEGLIRALICNGHVILEGVPGTAKTLLIKALGKISDCEVKRIQFTVDLLPTDIIGVTTYKEKKGFKVIKGPIFGNFIIADEINRAPPKTQSALLEAMQERQVTIGRETFPLPKPFFVMATKNPIESAGVYSLPEAQLDRFLFRLLINYPKNEEEKLIMKQNADLKDFEDFDLKQVISKKEIIEMQKIVKKVYLNKKIEDYIIKIVDSTRNKKNRHSKFIEWGASPRASIALFIASKAEALMSGRSFVVPEDVKKVTLDVLGHRIILSYEAEANEISPEKLLEGILKDIK